MLVLTRKSGEAVALGDDIQVRILQINKNDIKLGIDAPRNIRILRQEIYEQIKEENLFSARASSAAVAEAVKLFSQRHPGGER